MKLIRIALAATLVFSTLEVYAQSADTIIQTPVLRSQIIPGGFLEWDGRCCPRGILWSNGNPTQINKIIVFTDNFWFGAKDQGEWFTSFGTYENVKLETCRFGPLAQGQTAPSDTGIAKLWKKVFRCDQRSVDYFRSHFHSGMSIYEVPDQIAKWPATGNPYIGFVVPAGMADFHDQNGDGIYDPLTGDFPILKGPIHTFSVTNLLADTVIAEQQPKPVTVKSEVYTLPFTEEDSYGNRTILIQRTFTNSGTHSLDSAIFGIWCDPDLGNSSDDYVGFNVTRDMAICYNGDSLDEGVSGFGSHIPALGCTMIDSPYAYPFDGIDNDKDGQIDEPDEKIGCSRFVYYNNSTNNKTGDPSNALQAYRYLNGLWRDGTTMTYDGLLATSSEGVAIPGIGPAPRTRYPFPGNTDPFGFGVGGTAQNPISLPEWTEKSAGNPPGDRRFLMVVGPFDLAPGESKSVTYSMLVGKPSPDSSNVQSGLRNLLGARDSVKTYYDQVITKIQAKSTAPAFVSLTPNPTTTHFTLRSNQSLAGHAYTVVNTLGQTLLTGPADKPVSVTYLPPGTYRVLISGPKANRSLTLIRQ